MHRLGVFVTQLLTPTLLATALTAVPVIAQQPGGMDRTVLPIPEPKRQTYKELDARNAKAPARWDVKAPAGAPNVIIVTRK